MKPFGRRTFAWIGLALVAAVVSALVLALDREPRVPAPRVVSHDDVARAVWLLRVHDPRRQHPGQRRTVTVQAREAELLLNHGLERRFADARAALRFERAAARAEASVALPAGFWLNAEARLRQTDALPAIESMRIGSLPLPSSLGAPLLRWAVRQSGHAEELRIARSMVQRVIFGTGLMSVTYAWDADAPRRLAQSLVPPDEQARLREYAEALAAVTAARAPGGTVPLPDLMKPLFERAAERTAAGHDAAAENRAAVLTLTLHATGKSLAKLLPAAADWAAAAPATPPTLSGREDFALHFLVSATIAIDGHSPLSKAVGIYKEVADARQGSGFSFNDIAADRAGTRFGERALAAGSAASLQKAIAAGVADEQLMPPWSDLPEFISPAEFKRRYDAIGSPEYDKLLAEIDRRIAALPLLR